MIWSIVGIVIILAIIYLRNRRYLDFVLATFFCLLWLVPTELAGWQEYWWMAWLITPIVLGLILFVIQLRWKRQQSIENEMDTYFSHVASNVRNSSIEKIIYKSIHKYPLLPKNNDGTVKKDGLLLPIVIESKRVPQNQHPAYLVALAYVCLYCNDDVIKASEYGKQALQELSCFNKDHIILDAYKWLYKENYMARSLFDENGNSLIPGNPLIQK